MFSGLYWLQYQTGGNLVLNDNEYQVVQWTSGATLPAGEAAGYCIMQGDGNLVLYTAMGTAYWSTKTNNQGVAPYYLIVQQDRNVVSGLAGRGARPKSGC